MPLYDFYCKKCDVIFELQMSFHDAKRAKLLCSRCGSVTTRQMPAPAVGLQCQPGIENPGFYKSKKKKEDK